MPRSPSRFAVLRIATLCTTALLHLSACSFEQVPQKPAANPAARSAQPKLAAGNVTLIRDRFGTPHLYALREEDGFYGLGYAYAADRLQELLLSYLRLRGELSDVFGRDRIDLPGVINAPGGGANLRSDLWVRRVPFLDEARRNFSQLPPQLQRDMQFFIRGVEAWMRQHPDKVPAWAPPLEPALPVAQLAFVTLPDLGMACDGRLAARDKVAFDATAGLPNLGSNAWALAPSRTLDGVTYFSSDTHGVSISDFGALFYNWRMKAGELDALSFDVAGAASFFFAHTADFAWGWTEGKRFINDCYEVRTEPDAPQRYRYDGELRTMHATPYRIEVKDEAPVVGVIETTDHNGIRSPVVERRGSAAYVLSSPYLSRIGLAAGAYYRMAKAHDRTAFFAALEEREIYPANLIAGGADGLVLYIRPGRIPIRAPGVDPTGLLDGNRSTTAWRGIHSFADLTKLVDPPQGYVTNSNISPDRMYPGPVLRAQDYPPYFGFEPGYINKRQLRFLQLLDGERRFSVAQAMDVAMDETPWAADRWAPAIQRAIVRADRAHQATPDFTAVARALASFDGALHAESETALYYAMLRSVLTTQHADDVDAIVVAVENRRPLTLAQDRILVASIRTVTAQLLDAFGTIHRTYGEQHRIARGDVSLPGGGGTTLAGYRLPDHTKIDVDGTQYAISDTIRAMAYGPRRLTTTQAETQRTGQRIPYLVAFTRPVQSWSILLPGISDDPASPHYADQAKLASERRLKPTYLQLDDLLQNHESIETLATAGTD